MQSGTKFIRALASAGLLSILIACNDGGGSGGGAQEQTPPLVSAPVAPLSIAQRIDAYLESNVAGNSSGISIVIVRDGAIFYQASKGMANIPLSTSISGQTGFVLASVSKIFTAIAIMQLVEKGQVNLSDSILNYLPELPAAWRAITIEQLLTHQSGIYDIFNDNTSIASWNGLTNDGVINYLIRNPQLEFTPGSRGDYNNTGYVLLAKIIERKVGYSFSEYMARNIFEPAGMKNSYISDEKQAIKPGDAINYASLDTYYGIKNYVTGASSQVSSTADFANFFAALRGGRLISTATLSNMTMRHSLLDGFDYGYGFEIGLRGYGHGGLWDGFRTFAWINPSTGFEWAILTNSGSAGGGHISAITQIITASP